MHLVRPNPKWQGQQVLVSSAEEWDHRAVKPSSIQNFESGQRFGKRVFHLEEIASTNDLALQEIEAGRAADGDIFLADRQTGGRGTKERSWESRTAEGLWLSVVLIGPSRAQPLPFLPAVALADLLQQEFKLPAHIKWPNDILVEGRKIAGILIESRSTQEGTSIVVGIGLNLSQSKFDGPLAGRATSLAMEGIANIDKGAILSALLQRMSLLELRKADLITEFKSRSRMFGASIETLKGKSYRVVDLSPEGYLVVRTKGGDDLPLISSSDGEISPDWIKSATPFSWAPPIT